MLSVGPGMQQKAQMAIAVAAATAIATVIVGITIKANSGFSDVARTQCLYVAQFPHLTMCSWKEGAERGDDLSSVSNALT